MNRLILLISFTLCLFVCLPAIAKKNADKAKVRMETQRPAPTTAERIARGVSVHPRDAQNVRLELRPLRAGFSVSF